MTDEDIKAIRMLEFIVNHNSLLGYKPENREALAEYIINLIEKQEKELEKKDAVIDKMAEQLEKEIEWHYSEFDNYTKQDFIKHFTNLVEKENK